MEGKTASVNELKNASIPTAPDDKGDSSEEDSSEGDCYEGDSSEEIHYDFNKDLDQQVSGEVRDLLQYISRHKSKKIDLEPAWKPFIPEYYPAISHPDLFLKVNYIAFTNF